LLYTFYIKRVILQVKNIQLIQFLQLIILDWLARGLSVRDASYEPVNTACDI